MQSSNLRCRSVASVTRLYPFVSGCGTFANSRLVEVAAAPPGRDVWARVEGGYALVPMRDWVGRAMYFVGDLDRKLSHIIDRCVSPGDIALDIGANLGLVSLRMASRVGATGHVHAFEPNPRMTGYLAKTLARNPSLPISLHPIALGSENCSLQLSVPADNMGAATLKREAGGAVASTVDVPVRRLAEYAAQIGLHRVDFIKMDVEGFEHEVVVGAQSLLARAAPRVIILEEHAGRQADGKLPASLDALSRLGYDIFGISKTLMTLSLKAVTADDVPESHDYAAIFREGTQAIRAALRIG